MLAVLVIAQSGFAPLTGGGSKNDGSAPLAGFNQVQACPVQYALPGHKARHLSPSIAQEFLIPVEKSQMCDLSQLDPWCPGRQSRCGLPQAEAPTLLALNCMLTV